MAMSKDLFGMNLAGSYAAGQGMAKQDLMLAMEHDAKLRERQKQQDIKDAIGELTKSGFDYTPEERAQMGVAMAARDEKTALAIHAAAVQRMQRGQIADQMVPAQIPGIVGTNQITPIADIRQRAAANVTPVGDFSNPQAGMPDTSMLPTQRFAEAGMVPNPNAWMGNLIKSGDKNTIEIMKLLNSKDYETHVTKAGDVIITDKTTGKLVNVTPASSIGIQVPETDKSQSEEQLTRAANFDPDPAKRKQAQSILDAMQTRKLAIAKAGASAQQEAKMEGLDLNSLAVSMKNGQMASEHVRNAFGVPIQGKVETLVREEYPNFDFVKNDANAKWQYNPGNQRTIAMTEAALPRLTMLADQVALLGNTNIPKINEVMRFVAKQTGKPEYTNFEANRNAIVQEINTALSGSATSSDLRVRIELENIQSARSPAQIIGAIQNLREALLSRLDTSLSVPYPVEVVRGEKTIAQYKTEMFNKYRGKYGTSGGLPAIPSDLPPGTVPNPDGTFTLPNGKRIRPRQ